MKNKGIGMKNREIADRILNNNERISDIAKTLGVTPPSVRSRLNTFCKNSNKRLYDSLNHSNIHGGGFFMLPPLVRVLREHKDEFLIGGKEGRKAFIVEVKDRDKERVKQLNRVWMPVGGIGAFESRESAESEAASLSFNYSHVSFRVSVYISI